MQFSSLSKSAQRQALLASGGERRFTVRFARARHLSSARFVGQTHDGRTALWASLHFATKRLCFDCFACRDWKYFARAIWHRINTKAKTRTAVLEMVDCTFFTNTIFFHVLPNGSLYWREPKPTQFFSHTHRRSAQRKRLLGALQCSHSSFVRRHLKRFQTTPSSTPPVTNSISPISCSASHIAHIAILAPNG